MMVMCQVSVRCMSNLNLSLTLVDVKLVVTAALRTEYSTHTSMEFRKKANI